MDYTFRIVQWAIDPENGSKMIEDIIEYESDTSKLDSQLKIALEYTNFDPDKSINRGISIQRVKPEPSRNLVDLWGPERLQMFTRPEREELRRRARNHRENGGDMRSFFAAVRAAQGYMTNRLLLKFAHDFSLYATDL